MSDKARLFVALDLDDEARRALARWRDGIVSSHPGLRPMASEALHVTLCFLGTHAIGDVDAIAADLDAITSTCAIGLGAPITGLRLGAAMWLPRRRPAVLAAAIDDETGALARVQSAIANGLRAGDWCRPEARPFLAHVSVARVAGDASTRAIPAPPPPPPVRLAEAATVTLYRSHLSSGGSRYEAVRIVSVGAPAGARDPAGAGGREGPGGRGGGPGGRGGGPGGPGGRVGPGGRGGPGRLGGGPGGLSDRWDLAPHDLPRRGRGHFLALSNTPPRGLATVGPPWKGKSATFCDLVPSLRTKTPNNRVALPPRATPPRTTTAHHRQPPRTTANPAPPTAYHIAPFPVRRVRQLV